MTGITGISNALACISVNSSWSLHHKTCICNQRNIINDNEFYW